MKKEELKHFNKELERYINIHKKEKDITDVYDIIRLLQENGNFNNIERKRSMLKAMNIMKHYIEYNVMSHFTLEDDEFYTKVVDGYRYNKRNKDIYKDEKNIYFVAYYSYIQRIINVVTDKIENVFKIDETVSRIYVSHKGMLTGDYFEDCIIKQYKIDNKYFNIISKPILPLDCFIDDKGNKMFVINIDNEKLNVLSKYYYINYKYDEEVAKHKIDISKYDKPYIVSKSKRKTNIKVNNYD